MKPALLVALTLAAPLVLGACGNPPPPSGDGGADADAGLCAPHASADGGARRDFINVNCTSLAGNEGIADCNQRLGQDEMGARVFIGGRADCDPDMGLLYSPNCQPLCDLSCVNSTETNGRACSFTTANPGCSYNQAEGYVVIVETNGRRQNVGVDDSGNCAMPGTAIHQYALVSYEGLRGAVQCARTMPMGGFPALRFTNCDTPDANCGLASAHPPDTCQQLMFNGPAGPYTANVCTRMCGSDMDCGARGSCVMGMCFEKCGGPCNLNCPMGQGCQVPMGATSGFCLPTPM